MWNPAGEPGRVFHYATSFKWQAGELERATTMPADPNLIALNKLAAEYRAAETELKRVRLKLDLHVQQLKREGYSFPVLARESGLAQGTIQNIVAKDPHVTMNPRTY